MDDVFVFHVRQARSKAKACATAEALCLLQDLQATAPTGGTSIRERRSVLGENPNALIGASS